MARVGRERVVVLVLYPGVRLLDVTGPLEVFTLASDYGARYALVTASLDGEDVTATGRLRLGADTSLDCITGPIDTLVVPGSPDWKGTTTDKLLLDQVRRLATLSARTAGICAGAFPLAAAGLLDGRRAATHWSLTATLAALYPQIAVDDDSIFVRDGRIITSAGITAGIDLALALVEEDYGADLARQVAKHMVVFLARPGGQSQFSVRNQATSPHRSLVSEALDAVTEDPSADHSLAALAARLSISERHLARLFRQELGVTPAVMVEKLRVEAAKVLLESSDDQMAVVARASGLGSPETMRRAFIRRLGVTPGAYRARFRSTGTG
jgi:transcriptional regulator GlxA family with amidase domain